MKNTLKYTTTCLGLLAVPLSASIIQQFDTDAAGNPIAGSTLGGQVGSFTGVGVVDGNITTGVGGADRDINGIGTGDVLGTTIVEFNPDVFGMDTTFGFGSTGGTADLQLNAKSGNQWKGWKIDNLNGVTEIKMTTVVEKPLHGDSSTSTNSGGLPWGWSTSLFTEGTGFTAADFDVTYTISGLTYLSDPLNPATGSPTVPATAVSLDQGGWDSVSLGSTALVYNSSDGFMGTSNGSGNPNNLLVRGLDPDGDGFTSDDMASVYATTFEVCIKPIGATEFANDTSFVFSFDGDYTPLPEPSSAFLISLGSFAFLGRRKR